MESASASDDGDTAALEEQLEPRRQRLLQRLRRVLVLARQPRAVQVDALEHAPSTTSLYMQLSRRVQRYPDLQKALARWADRSPEPIAPSLESLLASNMQSPASQIQCIQSRASKIPCRASKIQSRTPKMQVRTSQKP